MFGQKTHLKGDEYSVRWILNSSVDILLVLGAAASRKSRVESRVIVSRAVD